MKRLLFVAAAMAGCSKSTPPAAPTPPVEAPVEPAVATRKPDAYNAVSRTDFNRIAVHQNLGYYWIEDRDADGNLDRNELATLLFYPAAPTFEQAYEQIVKAAAAPADLASDDGKRRALVMKDLDQGRPTLVATDFTQLTPNEQTFARTMLKVAALVDTTYEKMNGAAGQSAQLPADAESRSLFRRNRGSKCVAPATENDPACSAIPGAPKPVFDLYPAELQATENFCKSLEKASEAVRNPFTVVRGTAGALTAVPYTEAYKAEFGEIAALLRQAAKELDASKEQPLVAYLTAAATSFETNDWAPADEAWAKMNVDNSSWYVRVAPDEVYWEPCALKAGLHLTFARINQGSRAWQYKLVPVQQEMEKAVAKVAGPPYKARPVSFHLPDFIDIVVNAGDDRDALGATIGQSLPNWGAVANEGRGRTIAMVNLYADTDSNEARRAQAASMLDAASMAAYTGAQEPGLLSTILHEVMHNLGPAHEYKVKGKKAPEVFGGPVASVFEELKAQSGALYFVEFLRARKLISDELATQTYTDAIVWALGHVSQGMYDGTGSRKTYSNVSAIQIGMLLEYGALAWDEKAPAANGSDTGALHINYKNLVKAVDRMMTEVTKIKARGDKAGADRLVTKYVDGKAVPQLIIQERFRRQPKASFVYAVTE